MKKQTTNNKNNLGLTNKLKVIIISLYTIVLFGTILLIFGTTKDIRFEDYGTQPYDEYIGLTIRDMEDRNSVYDNKTGTEKGKHESSTYNTQLVITKLKSNTPIDEIKIYFAARTVKNRYVYEEYAASTKNMSATVYSSITSFNGFAVSEYDKITKNNETVDYFFNEKPVEYMVKVQYKVNNEQKEITYKTGVLETVDYTKFETRDKLSETDSLNPNYIDNKKDPVKVLITTKAATETSTTRSVFEDQLNINVKIATTNLFELKYDEEHIKNNKLKELERATNTNVVNPEITDMKVEVFVKVKAADSNLSEYVKVYSVYGFLSRYVSLSQGRVKLEESLNMSESDVYINIVGTIHNGTKDSFSASYKINYKNLKAE